MKTPILLGLSLAFSLPALAQTEAPFKPINGLPFPLVTPDAAEKAAVTAPIKLNLKEVTLAQALEELRKQSGVEFSWNSEESKEALAKTLSIELETRSFNRAFADIMDEAGVKASLQRYDSGQPWRIAFGGGDSARDAMQSETGLFRVRLSRLNTVLSKTVNLGMTGDRARAQGNSLNVSLSLLPDLRLPLLGTPRARIESAEDDQGRSLQMPTEENQDRYYSYYSFYGSSYERAQSTLRLRAPEKDAKTLAHLDGVMIYVLVAKTEKWEIPDLLAEKQWTREFKSDDQKFQVTLKPTLQEDKRVNLGIEVVSNRANAEGQVGPPLLATGPLLSAMKIVDANGQILRSNNGGSNSSNQKLTTTATFYPRDRYNREEAAKPLALPLQFVFEAPVGVVQTEVPFSFEEVPLP